MLGQNSRQNLWTPMQAQLGSLSRQKKQCRDIATFVFVFRLCCGIVATFSTAAF